MTTINDWETFAAVVAGIRASVCGPEAIVFSWAPLCPVANNRRIVKIAPLQRGGSGFFSCLFSGWTGSAAAVPNTTLEISSVMVTEKDPKPVPLRKPAHVRVSEGTQAPHEIAAVITALWDHSRALWVPHSVQSILKSSGPERTLSLATPVSRCFKVCVHVAAGIARPTHTVSSTIRSPTGGSAILKSVAYTGTLVLNANISDNFITVVGKREGLRAYRSARPMPKNLDLVAGDNGWTRKKGHPTPLHRGALEETLFSLVQAIVETIEHR